MKSKYISPHHVLTVHYVKLLYFIYISIYLIITIIYLFLQINVQSVCVKQRSVIIFCFITGYISFV